MSDSQQNDAVSHACNGLIISADDLSTTIDDVNGAATNNNGVTTTPSGGDSIIRIDEDNEKYFNSLPPGCRFYPTDSELIVHYLIKKIKKESLPRHRIHDVNIYGDTPEVLSELYPLVRENEWYFFTPRYRKYLNGSRPSRRAGTGFWKATIADKPVKNDEGSTIGFKKTLVFYEGKSSKGKKTSWIMHEFTVKTQPRERTSADDMRLDDYVLCKIYEKKSYKSQQKNEDEHQHGEINVHLPADPHSQGKMDDRVEEDYQDYSQVQSSPPPQLPVCRNYSQVQPPPPPLPVQEYGDCPQVQSSLLLQLPVYGDYSQAQPSPLPQLPVYGDYSQVQPSLPLQLPDYGDYSQVNLPPLPLSLADCRDQPQVLLPPLPVQESFTTNVLGADYHDRNWSDFKEAQNDCLPLP